MPSRAKWLILFIGLGIGAFVILRGCQPSPSVPPIRPRAEARYTVYLPSVAVRYNAKHGVVDLSTCDDVRTAGGTWTYVYYPVAPTCPGVENIPMIQSESQMDVPISGNSAWVLGFNEPDFPGWAQQTSAQAAQNWRTIEQMYPDRKLVSPSVTSAYQFDQSNWLRDFRAEYIARYGTPPRLDALAVHIYFGYPTDATIPVSQAIQLARDWNIPEVWVTEWGMPYGSCQPNSPDLPEIGVFARWMDAQPMIARYAWFGTAFDLPQPFYPATWCDLSLVKNGQLTEFGKAYTN